MDTSIGNSKLVPILKINVRQKCAKFDPCREIEPLEDLNSSCQWPGRRGIGIEVGELLLKKSPVIPVAICNGSYFGFEATLHITEDKVWEKVLEFKRDNLEYKKPSSKKAKKVDLSKMYKTLLEDQIPGVSRQPAEDEKKPNVTVIVKPDGTYSLTLKGRTVIIPPVGVSVVRMTEKEINRVLEPPRRPNFSDPFYSALKVISLQKLQNISDSEYLKLSKKKGSMPLRKEKLKPNSPKTTEQFKTPTLPVGGCFPKIPSPIKNNPVKADIQNGKVKRDKLLATVIKETKPIKPNGTRHFEKLAKMSNRKAKLQDLILKTKPTKPVPSLRSITTKDCLQQNKKSVIPRVVELPKAFVQDIACVKQSNELKPSKKPAFTLIQEVTSKSVPDISAQRVRFKIPKITPQERNSMIIPRAFEYPNPKPVSTEYRKPTLPELPKSVLTEYQKPLLIEYQKPLLTEYHKPLSTEYHKPLLTEYHKPLLTECLMPELTEYPNPISPDYPKPDSINGIDVSSINESNVIQSCEESFEKQASQVTNASVNQIEDDDDMDILQLCVMEEDDFMM